MKHYILPALFWALAISQTFAQKTLPPGAQAQLENWPRSVKKMMRSAGYDLENPSASTTVQSRNAPLQLDSTKTFYHYDPTGAADSLPILRNIYLYPQSNVFVELESQIQDGQWTPLSRFTKTEDPQGRVREVLAEGYDPATGTFQPDSRLLLFPRGNSLEAIDSINAFIWDSIAANWAIAFQLKNTFGPQDRLLVSRSTIEVDGQVLVQADHYSYNANQDNHLIESFWELGSFAIPSGKKELMYIDHRLIQEIDFVREGTGAFVPTERITYLHNAAKLIQLQNVYKWVPGVNDWSLAQEIHFDYDNSQRLTKQELVATETGQITSKSRTTYTYIQEQDVALETNYSWDAAADVFILDTRKYYYYDGGTSSVSPLPNRVEVLSMSPNPTTGEVRFPLQVETDIRVFDAAGQLVQSRIVQPGETLNLNGMPNGIYQVTARSEQHFLAGKIVKQ